MNAFRALLGIFLVILALSIAILAQSYVVVVQPTDADGTIDHNVTWQWNHHTYSLEYSVPISELEGHQNLTILRNYCAGLIYPKYITPDESTVRSIAESLSTMTDGLSDVDCISFVNKFVNAAIDYHSDSSIHGTSEYYQFPIETLASKKGDCEDMALLEISILKAMGYDSVPIVSMDHCTVGVNVEGASGNKIDGLVTDYYLVEPVTGRSLGDSSSVGVPLSKGISLAIFSLLIGFSVFVGVIKRQI